MKKLIPVLCVMVAVFVAVSCTPPGSSAPATLQMDNNYAQSCVEFYFDFVDQGAINPGYYRMVNGISPGSHDIKGVTTSGPAVGTVVEGTVSFSAGEAKHLFFYSPNGSLNLFRIK